MLLKFHYVLVSCTLLFSLVYGTFRFVDWRRGGGEEALQLVAICSVGTVACALYIVYLVRGGLRAPRRSGSENHRS